MSPPDTECLASRLRKPSRTRRSRRSTGRPFFLVARENAEAAGVSGRYQTLEEMRSTLIGAAGRVDLALLVFNFLHQLDGDACVGLASQGS